MSSTVERGSLAKISDSTQFFAHQVEGIRRMARMPSFLLADEMGLGKSLQALTVAAIDFEMGLASRVLIVAPASLKWNWLDEIAAHTSFTAHVLDGSPAKRKAQLAECAENGTEVVIINYEQVQPHLAELNAMAFDIVIADEAHYIKSHKSKRTKAFMKLKAKRYFLLSGSFLLNNVNELWAPLHRVQPDEYPNYWTFLSRYAVFGGFKDKEIVGVKNRAELTDRIQSVMIRRLKKDVLDLPDKTRIKVWVDLHPEQEKLYKQANEELMIELPTDPDPLELENALTKFLRLKQLCSTTWNLHWEKGKPEPDPRLDKSIKLDVAIERVRELVDAGERVVIFTQFRGTVAALCRRLDEAGIPSWQLHGDVPMRDRKAQVDAWASHPEPGAMVAMLQVAGVGLNMTAASTCIFVDKLFVPKLNEQAEDRIHRIGADTSKPITIVEILCRNTIEQRIESILGRKSELHDQLIEVSDLKRRLLAALIAEEDDE